jgi:hypothetical protein
MSKTLVSSLTMNGKKKKIIKKGVLNGTKMYLAGNLQCESSIVAKNWRKKFAEDVAPLGIKCLNPLERVFKNFPIEGPEFHGQMFDCIKREDYFQVHKRMKDIRRRDLAMVDMSNAFVCVLNSKVPTYGSLEELSVAVRARKPVFLVIQPSMKDIPLWVLGMVTVEQIFENLDDVVQELHLINSGYRQLDNKYWRLFSEEYL